MLETDIASGSYTTYLNLTWVLSLLLNHEHVLKRAQEEMDLMVSKDKWIQDSDIENLPYLQAIVKETLRLYPIAPLAVPHEAKADCIVSSYLIPKGVDASGRHFEFISFGLGRRSCPGAVLALRVTHLTLARLHQGFDLATPSNKPVDMTEGLGITLPKATPLRVVLTLRLPPKLYEQLTAN